MIPLVVMLVSWILAGLVGVLSSGRWVHSWTEALRIALAAMFVFTAASHFHPQTRRI